MPPSVLFLAHCSKGEILWTQQNLKFCFLHIFYFVVPNSSGASFHSALSVWPQCSCAVLLYKSKSCHDCELQTESKARRKVWIQQLLLLMRMSNLIRCSKDERSGPAAAVHSRTQEHYYKIITRTDGPGLAQSEFASGDLSQIDKHLLLPGGNSVGSVCGLTSVGKACLMVLKMAKRRSFYWCNMVIAHWWWDSI